MDPKINKESFGRERSMSRSLGMNPKRMDENFTMERESSG